MKSLRRKHATAAAVPIAGHIFDRCNAKWIAAFIAALWGTLPPLGARQTLCNITAYAQSLAVVKSDQKPPQYGGIP
jgi:hypothetical protein